MRVAFQHQDPEHPNGGTPAAFRLGRVQQFTHPVTGESTSAEELMVALLDQARKEYREEDGYKVWPERIAAVSGELGEPDSEAEWRPIDEDALRARASGDTVDVPEVADLPLPQQTVELQQASEATQEG